MDSTIDGRFLVVVAFLIERHGQVLVLRRSMMKDHAAGEWDLGSGRVRQGESALEAVFREAKEETGLDVEVLGLLDTFHFYRGQTREEAIGITFHCRATGGDLTLSAEHDEVKRYPLINFKRLTALTGCDDLSWHCWRAAIRRQYARADDPAVGAAASRRSDPEISSLAFLGSVAGGLLAVALPAQRQEIRNGQTT